MGQIRECTVCARRMYSLAIANYKCTKTNRMDEDCLGVMRLITEKDRPRNRFKLDGTKLGEFW